MSSHILLQRLNIYKYKVSATKIQLAALFFKINVIMELGLCDPYEQQIGCHLRVSTDRVIMAIFNIAVGPGHVSASDVGL